MSDSWITWVAGNLEDKDLKKANRLERNNGSEPPPGQGNLINSLKRTLFYISICYDL